MPIKDALTKIRNEMGEVVANDVFVAAHEDMCEALSTTKRLAGSFAPADYDACLHFIKNVATNIGHDELIQVVAMERRRLNDGHLPDFELVVNAIERGLQCVAQNIEFDS